MAPAAAALTIEQLRRIMEQVERQTITHDDEDFEANPVLTASRALYDCLKAAGERVVIEGQIAIDQAVEAVTTEWNTQRLKLEERAGELLTAFQAQVTQLLYSALETIAASVPQALAGAPLDAVAFKLSLALSPSVALSATEWLKLVATAGVEVQITYKATGQIM